MRYRVLTSVMAYIGMSIYDKYTDKVGNGQRWSFSGIFLGLMGLLWSWGMIRRGMESVASIK